MGGMEGEMREKMEGFRDKTRAGSVIIRGDCESEAYQELRRKGSCWGQLLIR